MGRYPLEYRPVLRVRYSSFACKVDVEAHTGDFGADCLPLTNLNRHVELEADVLNFIHPAHQRKGGDRKIFKVSLQRVKMEELIPCRPLNDRVLRLSSSDLGSPH